MVYRKDIEMLRLMEETFRDQSAYARQRNLDNPSGHISGEVLYGISQAFLLARVQLEQRQTKRKWYNPWSWT